MAALALASADADDVFEAVASHLRRPPFSRTLTAQDLRDGRDLKTLLYEVCADIDAARAPRDAADAAAGARRARAGLQRRHRVGAAAAEAAVDQVRGLRPARPDLLRAAAVAAAADVGARAATAARAPGFRRAVPGDAARRLQRSYDPRRDGRLLGAAPGRRAPRVRAAAGARVSHPAAAARVDVLVARRKVDSSRKKSGVLWLTP